MASLSSFGSSFLSLIKFELSLYTNHQAGVQSSLKFVSYNKLSFWVSSSFFNPKRLKICKRVLWTADCWSFHVSMVLVLEVWGATGIQWNILSSHAVVATILSWKNFERNHEITILLVLLVPWSRIPKCEASE